METLRDVNVFKEIAEHSSDEIFVTDGKGIVLYVNGACKQHYGLDANELIGRSVRELEERLFYPSATLEVLKTEKPTEMIQNTAWGKRLFVKSRPIFNEYNEMVRVISYARDLTEIMTLKQQVNKLERKLSNIDTVFTSEIIAGSDCMKRTLSIVERTSISDTPILLKGETGVGKELLAKRIHSFSPRENCDFISIGCPVLKDNRDFHTRVLNRLTRGSTLYLDEIGELSIDMQSNFLELLKSDRNNLHKMNLRILASTSKNMDELINTGRFKEELYYRLNVITLNVPPLRDRKKDIYPLTNSFLNRFNAKHGRISKLSPVVVSAFLEYDWPGNVRELRNLIENLVITSNSEEISIEQLPPKVRVGSISSAETLPQKIEKMEKMLVMEAYDLFGSSYKVAEHLGISQSSAIRKIRKYITDR